MVSEPLLHAIVIHWSFSAYLSLFLALVFSRQRAPAYRGLLGFLTLNTGVYLAGFLSAYSFYTWLLLIGRLPEELFARSIPGLITVTVGATLLALNSLLPPLLRTLEDWRLALRQAAKTPRYLTPILLSILFVAYTVLNPAEARYVTTPHGETIVWYSPLTGLLALLATAAALGPLYETAVLTGKGPYAPVKTPVRIMAFLNLVNPAVAWAASAATVLLQRSFYAPMNLAWVVASLAGLLFAFSQLTRFYIPLTPTGDWVLRGEKGGRTLVRFSPGKDYASRVLERVAGKAVAVLHPGSRLYKALEDSDVEKIVLAMTDAFQGPSVTPLYNLPVIAKVLHTAILKTGADTLVFDDLAQVALANEEREVFSFLRFVTETLVGKEIVAAINHEALDKRYYAVIAGFFDNIVDAE